MRGGTRRRIDLRACDADDSGVAARGVWWAVNGASSQRGAGCEQDSLLEGWGDPRFAVVKMDVEGRESAACSRAVAGPSRLTSPSFAGPGAECDVLKGGGSEEYSFPRRGHPCPCSPLLLLSPPPGGQRLFSRSPPRFLYAELKQPHVEACWREAALRRTATARRRRGCERRLAHGAWL